jgi:hypothetical protein
VTKPHRIIILILLLCQPPLLAADKEVAALPALVKGDTLTVMVPLGIFISAEDSISMVNGETLSIICRLELWQKRKLWFDRLRLELVGYAEITYDRWAEKFTASGLGATGSDFDLEFSQLDSLMSELEIRQVFPFNLEPNDYNRESYVACAVELQYLTPDKLTDLKDWLFSGKRGRPVSPKDRHQSLPGKLVNIALNSTGFRNRSYLKSSLSFYPGQIPQDGDVPVEGVIKFPTSLN